jgi:hypothetical protein
VRIMFIESKVTKPKKNRRPVQGVGINDADYVIGYIIGGKHITCPFYRKWAGMLNRCYSEKTHKENPTYKDCTVCDEWLTFSTFKSWMIKQDWKGNHLDKDILIQGNRVYSPKACIFVSHKINTLIIPHSKKRKGLSTGVFIRSKGGKFIATCSDGKRVKTVGYYDTDEEARLAYNEFKYTVIKEIAEKQTEPLRSALLNYKL